MGSGRGSLLTPWDVANVSSLMAIVVVSSPSCALRLLSRSSVALALCSLRFLPRLFFFIFRASFDKDDGKEDDEEGIDGSDVGPPGGIFAVVPAGPAPAACVSAGGGICGGAWPPAFAG